MVYPVWKIACHILSRPRIGCDKPAIRQKLSGQETIGYERTDHCKSGRITGRTRQKYPRTGQTARRGAHFPAAVQGRDGAYSPRGDGYLRGARGVDGRSHHRGDRPAQRDPGLCAGIPHGENARSAAEYDRADRESLARRGAHGVIGGTARAGGCDLGRSGGLRAGGLQAPRGEPPLCKRIRPHGRIGADRKIRRARECGSDRPAQALSRVQRHRPDTRQRHRGGRRHGEKYADGADLGNALLH